MNRKSKLKNGISVLSRFIGMLKIAAISLFLLVSNNVIAMANDATASSDEVQQSRKKQITGTITDDLGDVVIGANIKEKGTTNGTVTDADGKFTLTVSDNAVLQVSYIGFLTQEVTVGSKGTVDITLKEDVKGLEEVVVVGYGTQKKTNLTGAVASVDADVLEDRPLTTVGSGLQGAIGNLNITTANGQPGTGATYNVRGTTNFAGAGALVLVDGIEMDPNLLNPADIKDVVVLKDAASSAIYGAKAAYGVVLITTKSGVTTAKPKISFSGNYAFNTPTVRPEYMNSIEYVQYMNDACMTSNGRAYFDDYEVSMVQKYFNDPNNNSAVFHHPNDAANTYRYCGNTDWYDVLNKSNYPIQQYNVNISGGNKDVRYYSSLGYFKQDGVSKWADEDYNRITNINNFTYSVTKWLQIGVKTTISLHNMKTGGQNKYGSSSMGSIIPGDSRPIMPLYHPDGHFAGYCNNYFTNLAAWQSQGGNSNMKKNDFLATGTVKLTPFEGFVVNADYSYKYYHYAFKNHMKEYWDYDAAGPAVIFPHTSPNSVTYSRDEVFYNVFNIYAEYTKQLNKVHNLKAMVGFNQEKTRLVGIGESRSNLISNDIPYLSLATGDRSTSDYEQELATRGVFFRLNYNYDEKYLLEINGRYDGSSRFPKDDRFKLFPSFSVGWKPSKEAFWEPISNIVNDLKIRGSWGQLGNQVSGSTKDGVFTATYYPYIANYTSDEINYLFNGSKQMGVYAPGLVSDALTWETVTQTDIGLDASLLDSKLTFTFDWYKRKTEDMLTKSKTLPAILGTSEPQMNAADLEVKGWEAGIEWKDALDNGLKYNVSFILSDYQAEITRYDNPTKSLNDDYYVGKKLGEIWGFETAGLFKTDAEAAAWDQSKVVGYKLLAGDIKFADINGDGKVDYGSNTVDDPGDRKVIGNSTPRYNFGIRLGGSWKNFDLSMFFQGVMKREVQASNTFFLSHYTSEWSTPLKINYDYWREDNQNAFFPRARLNGSAATIAQTRFLQDASYIRLKNLAIGYTIPENITQKAGISKLRVYFNADNLWEHSGVLKIFDPELVTANAYPFVRSYSFGVNLSF